MSPSKIRFGCLFDVTHPHSNIYPVVENHAGPKSLMGAALKNGFTSHYVVTDRAGVVVTGPTQHKTWDEIVIPQEVRDNFHGIWTEATLVSFLLTFV